MSKKVNRRGGVGGRGRSRRREKGGGRQEVEGIFTYRMTSTVRTYEAVGNDKHEKFGRV